MSAKNFASLINFSGVLSSKVSEKTKKILLQIGNFVGEGLTSQDDVSLWQTFGFASRPSKADKGKDAAQVLVVRVGGEGYAIAGQDTRDLAIYGNLAEGETCVYATGGDGDAQGRILLKKDGSVTAYTRQGNTASGAGMMMQLDAANGAIRLVSPHGHGLIIDEDGVKIFTSAASITLGADGGIKSIATATNQVDGSNIALGSLPLPGVGAVLTGVTGIAGKASLKVTCE